MPSERADPIVQVVNRDEQNIRMRLRCGQGIQERREPDE
jgi:hypothetical protein